MLKHDHVYVRTRGIILIAVNAKWDKEEKIEQILTLYLEQLNDHNPILVRQMLQVLPLLVWSKPSLKPTIIATLRHLDLTQYQANMRFLIEQDVAKCLHDLMPGK